MLLLVPAVVAILVGHYVMRPAASSSRLRRFLQWALPSALIIPEVLQHCTGYSIAVRFGPEVVLLTALAGYVLLMLPLWRISRWWGGLGFALLGIPAGYILWHFMGYFFLGLIYFNNETEVPAVSARVSAVATYRIVEEIGPIGRSSSFLYVYRNPRWLPFVRREIRREPLPCGDSARPSDIWVHSGSNEFTVLVGCNHSTTAQPEQIMLR